MALVTDTFTGTAGTELSVYNASWVKNTVYSAEDLTIDNNGRIWAGNTGNGFRQYYRSEDPGLDNYEATVDIIVLSDDAGAGGVGVRTSTTDETGYFTILGTVASSTFEN